MAKKKAGPVKKGTQRAVDGGRRNLVYLGLSALAAGATTFAGYKAGWFTSSPPGTPPTSGLTMLPPVTLTDGSKALAAADEMIGHYARGLDNASALIHAVRGLGKGFKRANGTLAVDFLCRSFAAEKEVNGKRYVYFRRDAEVHDNSFLKTFLEANVSLDQPVLVGSNRYTLRDVADSAKSLFRFDPQNMTRFEPTLIHDHLPWTLVAFSILTPPAHPEWTNAYGEKINLTQVIDRSLAEFEKTSALAEQSLVRGEAEPIEFRETIKKYSCFGLHTVYGFLSCLKYRYRENDLTTRLTRLMDNVSYRLKGDTAALESEYQAEGKGAPPIVVNSLYLRALIKLYGHAFESINYVKLHSLLAFSSGEDRRFADGGVQLERAILNIRSLDWSLLRRNVDQMLGPGRGDTFISDIIIGLGHASRGMKLLSPQNPDVAA